jgi:hypothetical protein
MTANLLEAKVASLSETDKSQNYYGLAIRRNVSNLEVMKRAVWAVFFHKLSTNEKPQHGVCPGGGDGASSGVAYEHKHSLPGTGLDEIEPVCRDLAGVDHLKECFHGKTHNSNEHANSII